MNKTELLQKLKDLSESYDTEGAHVRADEAIIEYINDVEIKSAFEEIEKWYA